MDKEVEERRAREKAARVSELEEQRQWHQAEIECAERTIRHHRANVEDVDDQLARLRGE